MAIINVDGVPVVNSTTPEVDGTNSVNNIQSFGQIDGGFINALREDDTLTLNTFDADSSGFEINGNEGNDTVTLDNNIEQTDPATGAVADFSAFGGKGDDILLLADLIVDSGGLFGNIGEDSLTVDTENAVNGLEINGNQDSDRIRITGSVLPDFDNSEVFGGKGDDFISATNIRNINNVLFSGDLDDDIISIGADTVFNSEILGGDQADSISLDASIRAQNNVINGNQGDDSISLTGTAEYLNNEIYGGKDNDTIDTTRVELTGGLVEGNIGEDSLVLGVLDGVAVNGNADDDQIDLTADIDSSSIWGGQGNDSISDNDTLSINIVDSVLAGDTGDDGIVLVNDALINSAVLGGDNDDAIILGTLDLDLSTPADIENSSLTDGTTADEDSIIDGGAGDDTIVFDGNDVEDATILGGEGADAFQLWNGGTVELTDFEAGTDTLFLGDYNIDSLTSSNVSSLKTVSFLTGVTVGLSTGLATIGTNIPFNLGNNANPLFSAANFTDARADAYRLATVAASNPNLASTSQQILFLDTEGTDAGLYVYTLTGAGVGYRTGFSEANFTADVTTNTNTIALGNFEASDIVVI